MTTTAQHIANSNSDASNGYYAQHDTPEARVELIKEACQKVTQILAEKYPVVKATCEVNDWGKFSNFDVHVTPDWSKFLSEYSWGNDLNLPRGLTNSVKAVVTKAMQSVPGVTHVELIDAPYKKDHKVHGDKVSKYTFMAFTFDVNF